jgi:hypothetical protein
MKHLSEEELIGEVYGEGTGPAHVHLAECPECHRAYSEVCADLDEFESTEPPERDDAYGERVWQAIAPELEAYEQRRPQWFSMEWMRPLSYAAACALLATAAFFAGRVWERGRPGTTANATTNRSGGSKRPILVVVLGDHLDRSERLLVELKHVDAENSQMIPPLRDEARSLLSANRICRKDAEKEGDPELEKALGRLDHLLSEMANQPDGLNAAAITRLQHEMNTDGLLFEVRVLRSRVHDGQLAAKSGPDGGTI